MTLQSTVASIQNIRKQRQLELELVELDRQWHLELKALARERLFLLKDLCRLQKDQRGAEHFTGSIHGPDLTTFTDTAHARLQRVKDAKLLRKYDFQPDPVEKMHLQLPLLPAPGEMVEVRRTAKEMYNHQVQVQKITFEQCVADRRSRRRPFWDKAYIGPKRKIRQQQQGRQGSLPVRSLAHDEGLTEARISENLEDLRGGRDRLIKSPSLPALNTLRRFDSLKPSTIHPSLSNRHSASLDYLPVIEGANRGQQHQQQLYGTVTSLKAPSVTSSVATLPTIDES